MPLPAKIRQIDGLQMLRALAVLLVSWLHAQEILFFSTKIRFPVPGVFGVDIFFVISGFILSLVVLRSRHRRGPEAAWEFLKRRLIRIFPIYWFFVLLAIIRMLLAHEPIGAEYLWSVLLLPPPSYPGWPLLVGFSWTLVFEMFFYYVLAAVQLVTVRRAIATMIALLSVAVLLGSFLSIRRPYLILAANPILLEFVFGAVVAVLYTKLGPRRVAGMILFGLGAVATVLLTVYFRGGANGMQMILKDKGVMTRVFTWGLAAAALVSGVVFWSPAPANRLGRVSIVLGNASYSAYLASSLVIEFTSRGLLRLWRNHLPLSLGPLLLCELAAAVAVFAAGWLCYEFIEWPMLRRLQKAVHSSAA